MSFPITRIMGHRHAVATGHYQATRAAMAVLEAGGNAADAGVAGGLALGVAQTEFVNIAGVAPIIHHDAATGNIRTISGVGRWPKAARVELFREEFDGRIPPGVLRTVVPAAPDAWLTALAEFGTMTFAEVAAAAIDLAAEGFPVSEMMHEIIASREEAYRRWPSSAAVYLPGGRAPKPGERFIQQDLAGVLRYMVDCEASASGSRLAGLKAARDAFYCGDIAQTITDFMAAEGGWLNREDMAEFSVEIEPAITSRFGNATVHACGPWCQGQVFAQAAGLLDGVDLAALGHNTPAYIHRLVETLKLAYADRHAHVADPRFRAVPMAEMLDPAYLAARRAMIEPDRAIPGMPRAGRFGDTDGSRPVGKDGPLTDLALDTSYICVVDNDGNAFSATPSDGSAEAPVVPGTGLVPSTRGAQSWTDPDHPACLAPGKRPRLTPNPAIVRGDDGELVPIGSPGNDVQPQAMLQAFLNMRIFGMTPGKAIAAPRFATMSFPRSTDPHDYFPDNLTLEDRFEENALVELSNCGHKVSRWIPWDWRAGGVCTIVAAPDGRIEASADPRRPGSALAR